MLIELLSSYFRGCHLGYFHINPAGSEVTIISWFELGMKLIFLGYAQQYTLELVYLIHFFQFTSVLASVIYTHLRLGNLS